MFVRSVDQTTAMKDRILLIFIFLVSLIIYACQEDEEILEFDPTVRVKFINQTRINELDSNEIKSFTQQRDDLNQQIDSANEVISDSLLVSRDSLNNLLEMDLTDLQKSTAQEKLDSAVADTVTLQGELSEFAQEQSEVSEQLEGEGLSESQREELEQQQEQLQDSIDETNSLIDATRTYIDSLDNRIKIDIKDAQIPIVEGLIESIELKRVELLDNISLWGDTLDQLSDSLSFWNEIKDDIEDGNVWVSSIINNDNDRVVDYPDTLTSWPIPLSMNNDSVNLTLVLSEGVQEFVFKIDYDLATEVDDEGVVTRVPNDINLEVFAEGNKVEVPAEGEEDCDTLPCLTNEGDFYTLSF